MNLEKIIQTILPLVMKADLLLFKDQEATLSLHPFSDMPCSIQCKIKFFSPFLSKQEVLSIFEKLSVGIESFVRYHEFSSFDHLRKHLNTSFNESAEIVFIQSEDLSD